MTGTEPGVDEPEPPPELPAYVVDPLRRQDRDTLEAVREYVGELIAAREAAAEAALDADELADAGEEVVDVEESPSGTRVIKKVPCGKDSCTSCPHGPYEYRVQRDGDTLDWEYVGAVGG